MKIKRRTEVTVFDRYVRLAGTLAAERGSTGGLPVVLRHRRGGQNAQRKQGSRGRVAALREVVGGVFLMVLLQRRTPAATPAKLVRLRAKLRRGIMQGVGEGDGGQDGVLKWEEKGRLL